ncbi:MAG: hypothetical protein ABH832_04415 [bacterium]
MAFNFKLNKDMDAEISKAEEKNSEIRHLDPEKLRPSESEVYEKKSDFQIDKKPEQSQEISGKKRRPPYKKIPLLHPKQDETTQKIEKIMEEGLGDAYSRLSPIAKQEFKLKGEQTAIKISQVLKSTHVTVKKILKLIIEWLRMLPGINKFFLEQEAKIKTDKILALK